MQNRRLPLPPSTFLVLGFVLVAQLIPLLPSGSALRLALTILFLFFAPGFALSSVLFTRSESRGWQRDSTSSSTDRSGLDLVERAAVSVGFSIAVLAILALTLSVVTGGVDGPLVGPLSVFLVVLLAVRVVQWRRLDETERETPALDLGVLTGTNSRTAFLNVALGLSVVLSLSTLGMGFVLPLEGDGSTGFAVGTQNDSGEFVAAGHDTELAQGQPTEVSFLIENNERVDTEYVIVASQFRQLQLEEGDSAGIGVRLAKRTVTVPEGESRVVSMEVTPRWSGDQVRFQYLLFKSSSAGKLTEESAYRTLHTWANVSSSTGEANADLTSADATDGLTDEPSASRPTARGSVAGPSQYVTEVRRV